jgi:hypothetical protein
MLKCGHITITAYPDQGSPGATIHGFKPDFSFFDWITCHISLHSMSCISGAIVGSSRLDAACRIQPSVVVRDTPNRFPHNAKRGLPKRGHNAGYGLLDLGGVRVTLVTKPKVLPPGMARGSLRTADQSMCNRVHIAAVFTRHQRPSLLSINPALEGEHTRSI